MQWLLHLPYAWQPYIIFSTILLMLKTLLRKSNLFFLFLAFITFSSYGQVPEEYSGTGESNFILSPGLSYQGQLWGELNMMYAKTQFSMCSGSSSWGPRLGLEFSFNEGHFVYAPKVGFEAAWFLFALRGNAVAYIDQGRTDLRLLPEVGLSLAGMVNLMYGNNIPLRDFRTTAIARHKISLTFNLNPTYWKGT